MSEELDWATTALKLETDREAEQWFEAVCDAYETPDGPPSDWTEFIARLYGTAEQAGFDNEKVNWFTEGLAARTSDPLAVVGELAENRSGLVRRYQELSATADTEAEETEAEVAVDEAEEWDKYTPAQWYEYLTQTMGDGWTGWDGSEEYWPTFWEYFLTYAEHAGVQEAATRFLTEIHESGDKVAAFAAHGITITAPPAAAEPDSAELLRDAVVDAQAAMDEIIAANPELASISEEARAQALAEALREFAQAEG